MMRNAISFVAVTLMTAFVVAGFWTGLLGAEGMKVFWTTMLCATALAVASRGSILSSPWAITLGVVCAGFLLGIPAKLIPATNTGFGHLSQSAGGLRLSEAQTIQSVALYGTVLVFLALGILEAFRPKSNTTNHHVGTPQADIS